MMKQLYRLLTIFFCVVCVANATAQVRTVTFTGRDRTNQYHIPLSKVTVFNLDQLWEEVLYYPDTVLVLGTVGIEDFVSNQEIQLMQNVPNPFDGTTEFALLLPEDRDVLLEIYDITGRLAVGKRFNALAAGTHLFQATLASPQVYLLSAKVDNGQMTIRMVNQGHGAGNTIRHLGMTDKNGDFTLYLKSDKASSNYPFRVGDEMQYIGSAVVDGAQLESEVVTQEQWNDETVTLKFDVTVPGVTTSNISDLTSISATCGGVVYSNGGSSVTSRGVCWSTLQNPTISSSHTTDGAETGSFTSSITELTPNTTYYVRAYATNDVGTGYGEQKSFTTPCNSFTVNISGNTTINFGQSTTLTATGANSYQWNTGATMASVTVSPTITTTYTVTGTNSFGCTATASVTVTVNPIAPTVTTNNVTNIGTNSATCGGNVTSTGGGTTIRGVCWSTSQNPTINDSHTSDGSGTGSFTSSITGLNPNTTYYVRAYATNSAGTSYGEQKTFATFCNSVPVNFTGNTTINYGQNTTLTASGANTYRWSTNATTASITVSPTATTTYTVTGTNSFGCTATASVTVTVNNIKPTVTTNNVSNIAQFTATCDGNVTFDGGKPVTARGVCWSTSQNPTIADNHTTDGTGTGSFTSNITGLTPNTTYYVRAYATNSMGTSYGEQKTFTTLCYNENYVTVVTDCEKYFWHNVEYTESGTYTYPYNNGYGCPCVDTLHLTIHHGTHNVITETVCGGYTWTQNYGIDTMIFESGTYTHAYVNEHGCNSVDTLHLTVFNHAITVITSDISNITLQSATCGGSVSASTTVTARGVCWSTSPNPTENDSHTTNGSGTGSFTSSLSGLVSGTTYYVRAYATNGLCTAYGEQKSFTTLALPIVATSGVGNITATSASCGGNVTSQGTTSVTARGVCWSTSQNPTIINDIHTSDGTGTGNFTSNITGLTPNTTYYVRAYATNSVGTSYGEQTTFKTNCNTVNISIAGSTSINYGQNTTLTASGANTYHWSTNATTASITVSPTATTTYTVTGTNGYGCTATTSVTVTVNYIAPIVITNEVTSIRENSAIGGGVVISDGGATLTARGVCWSTSQNPTINDSHTNDGSGTGSFSSSITELTPNTTYYVRAYATNSVGTSYGEQRSFTTAPSGGNDVLIDEKSCPFTPTVTDHEGNVYATVQIGNQCWMRENLRTTTSPSTGTYLVTSANNYTFTGKQARWYNNDPTTYAPMKCGLLYNWNAAVDTFNISFGETSVYNNESNAVSVSFTGHRRGICPAGWHLPSDAEWTQLTNYVSSQSEYVCGGNSNYIAKALADSTGWHSYTDDCAVGNNPSANNATGFSVRPAGYYNGSYNLNLFDRNAGFWSTTEIDDSHLAYRRSLVPYNASVYRDYNSKFLGWSVRCLRDETSTAVIDSKSCPADPTVTDHEGNVYATVQIGNQCWMRENLRTTTSPSTGTYLVTSANNYTFTGKQARWYNNDSTTYAPMKCGLLYNWNAAVDTFNTSFGEISVNTSISNGVSVSFTGHRRGICPVGWHLPSDAEWTQLTNYVSSQSEYMCGGNSNYIAKALADSIGWHSSTNTYYGTCAVYYNLAANNATGFSAFPAGAYGYTGDYLDFGDIAYFVCSSQYTVYDAYCRVLYDAVVDEDYSYKANGLSVRCLRDETSTAVIDSKSCPADPTVTDHEGNVYATVQIGNQCWMRENLRTTTSPSTGTYLITSANNTTYTGKQARWYNNDSTTYGPMKYGLFYNWNAAVDTFNTSFGETSVYNNESNAVSVSFIGHRRGICPAGWHLPSDAEWTQLTNYVSSQSEYVCGGNSNYIAKALADSVGWNSYTDDCAVGNNPSANNATGFSALPVALGSDGGSVTNMMFGEYSVFWGSTDDESLSVYRLCLASFLAPVDYDVAALKCAYISVRCLRD